MKRPIIMIILLTSVMQLCAERRSFSFRNLLGFNSKYEAKYKKLVQSTASGLSEQKSCDFYKNRGDSLVKLAEKVKDKKLKNEIFRYSQFNYINEAELSLESFQKTQNEEYLKRAEMAVENTRIYDTWSLKNWISQRGSIDGYTLPTKLAISCKVQFSRQELEKEKKLNLDE